MLRSLVGSEMCIRDRSTPDDSTVFMYEESSESRSVERSTLASDARLRHGTSEAPVDAQGAPRVPEVPVERWSAKQVNEWEQAEVCITLTEMPVVMPVSYTHLTLPTKRIV
eukprot:TRINITY_DN53249_c0_g1_i1.p1 TRINITY_DN53249_c0_g1~~TRINITY_DN53249_c0_g1_i1.p1  ORF type:complete len:111 (+),score=28.50 TRINITY_DN53249_c0_g1_i1:99-431(+)